MIGYIKSSHSDHAVQAQALMIESALQRTAIDAGLVLDSAIIEIEKLDPPAHALRMDAELQRLGVSLHLGECEEAKNRLGFMSSYMDEVKAPDYARDGLTNNASTMVDQVGNPCGLAIEF